MEQIQRHQVVTVRKRNFSFKITNKKKKHKDLVNEIDFMYFIFIRNKKLESQKMFNIRLIKIKYLQKAHLLNPYVDSKKIEIRESKIQETENETKNKKKKQKKENSIFNLYFYLYTYTYAHDISDESEGAFAGFEGLIIPGNIKIEDDGKDIVAGKQSHVVTANKMLADLLERKSSDPPFNISGDMNNKRKIDANTNATAMYDEPLAKRSNTLDFMDATIDDNKKNLHYNPKTQSSSSAANLYAKLAASLLEDEDMDGDETIVPTTTHTHVEQQKPVITVPMQRQIIVSPNNPPQMILASSGTNSQMGQATATIKTGDGGYQTVPVILQPQNQCGNIQLQKQIGSIGQQLIQPVIQQQQTQYVLATNQQGQTYLVAQQQPPPVNQILLTQTSQQQGGTPTKTIFILQQQAPGNNSQNSHPILGTVNSAGGPQKMIMTTQQGQQMIVTQGKFSIHHFF